VALRLLLSAAVRAHRNAILLVAIALSLGAPLGFAAQQTQGTTKARAAAPAAPVKRLYSKTAKPLSNGAIVRIGGHRHVSQAAYRDLRNASIALMKVHPPDKSIYIGLGRDPAPFIAFLQEIGADALNFPASGGYFSASPEMDRHFEKLIPKKYRDGNKNLVLIDQTRSGKTHAAMMPLLRDYLKRKGHKVTVKAVAYNQGAISNTGLGIRVIDTTPFPEVYKFFYSPYEGVVSPFNRHVPGQNTVEQLTMRKQYDQFRAGVRKRIQRDAVLDRYLSAFVGSKAQPETRAKAWNVRRLYKGGLSDVGRGPLVTLGDPQNGHGAINSAEYDEIRWGAQKLLERHAPDEGRFYLGAGRGSSAIVAFMENLGAPVGYMPTDGLKAGRMSPEWSKIFTKNLAEAVPKEALKRGDTITVFHHGASAGADALKQVVQRYVRAAKSQSRVEVVTFSGTSTSYQNDGTSTILTRGRSALQRLNGNAFAPIAQYAYHPGEALPPSDYPKLKSAIQDRMQRDKELDDFLNAPEF
jgi:hypothetical protein